MKRNSSVSISPVLASLAAVFSLSLAASSFAADAPAGDQVAAGQKLYTRHCSRCHGKAGEGVSGPAVVGKAALPLDPPEGAKVRTTKFHTAADVLEFISANMPGGKPGSLKREQYEAILAFDLKANGVDVSGRKIDAASARAIVLHP